MNSNCDGKKVGTSTAITASIVPTSVEEIVSHFYKNPKPNYISLKPYYS